VLIGGNGDDDIDVLDTSGNASMAILPNTQVTVSGGEGDDTIFYDRGLFITDANDGGADKDSISFTKQTILTLRDKSIENIETATFSSDNDSVIFADGNNIGTVNGGSGNDFLDASRETSSGYSLNGGNGYDTLVGGAGNDKIAGGQNADVMTGNKGADTFSWNESVEGNDTITDFDPDTDKLQFTGKNFGGISDLIEFVGVETGKNDEVITINTNLFVATGKGYGGIDSFYNEFVKDTIVGKDSNNPGFYVFYNSSTEVGELWYDPNMNKNSFGDETLIVSFTNVSASNQLARIGDDDFLFPTL